MRASAMHSSRCVREDGSKRDTCAFLSRSKAEGARGLEDLSGWIKSESVLYWAFIWLSGMPG